MVSLNTMLRILTGKIPRSYDRPHHQPCQGCFVLAIMHGAYVEFGLACVPLTPGFWRQNPCWIGFFFLHVMRT